MDDKKKTKSEALPENIKIRSGIMAQRLRELRTSKGMSYERLSDELNKLHGFTISPDSLQFYEVAAEHHSKAFHNTGMKVQYLYALADYYGVSADYILGYDVPKTPNATIKQMSNETGIDASILEMLITKRGKMGPLSASLFSQMCNTVVGTLVNNVDVFNNYQFAGADLMDLPQNKLIPFYYRENLSAYLCELIGRQLAEKLHESLMKKYGGENNG